MSELAIRLGGISKQYHIGKRQEDRGGIRDILTRAIVGPLLERRAVLLGQGVTTSFWTVVLGAQGCVFRRKTR